MMKTETISSCILSTEPANFRLDFLVDGVKVQLSVPLTFNIRICSRKDETLAEGMIIQNKSY